MTRVAPFILVTQAGQDELCPFWASDSRIGLPRPCIPPWALLVACNNFCLVRKGADTPLPLRPCLTPSRCGREQLVQSFVVLPCSKIVRELGPLDQYLSTR
jgi:hypothetical protein